MLAGGIKLTAQVRLVLRQGQGCISSCVEEAESSEWTSLSLMD